MPVCDEAFLDRNLYTLGGNIPPPNSSSKNLIIAFLLHDVTERVKLLQLVQCTCYKFMWIWINEPQICLSFKLVWCEWKVRETGLDCTMLFLSTTPMDYRPHSWNRCKTKTLADYVWFTAAMRLTIQYVSPSRFSSARESVLFNNQFSFLKFWWAFYRCIPEKGILYSQTVCTF